MYNRYIPQADGSYRRNRMQDPCPPPPKPQPPPPCQPKPEQEKPPRPQPANPKPCPVPPRQDRRREMPCANPLGGSVTGFLRQLLPKDFDTGDLLIVLLLLLMAGDCAEDQNTALLTLAIYLFL